MKGHNDEVYAAAWEFLKFVLQVDNSITWHKKTGYFPSNKKGYEELKAEGWFEKDPRFATAFDQINGGSTGFAATGVLLGNFVQIRDVVGTGIEEILVGMKDPKTVLTETKKKCDQILTDYIL